MSNIVGKKNKAGDETLLDEPTIGEPTIEKKIVVQKVDGATMELSLLELEFLIRLIGNSNFKGNDLMFVYDLVKKLQDSYIAKKGRTE